MFGPLPRSCCWTNFLCVDRGNQDRFNEKLPLETILVCLLIDKIVTLNFLKYYPNYNKNDVFHSTVLVGVYIGIPKKGYMFSKIFMLII